MSLLHLYDLPSWLFGAIVVGAFVAFALTGQLIVRRFQPRWFGDKDYNDMVGQYLSASGVFFGITLGLLSVGAWENFTSVDGAVSQEATEIGVFYRIVNNYAEPGRTVLTDQVRTYTRNEIDLAWPKQRQGITPGPIGNRQLDEIHRSLTQVELRTDAQKVLHGEALHQFSQLVRARRARLASVSTQLPPIVWIVVFGGSVLNLSLMWLFVVENKALHLLLTTILASLLGLLVFLLAIMDFPFRGDYSVGPDAFELIYQQLMTK
ncbi:MAG: DUF4239 domain-containing protein [Verrucomicrobia bacterium]|nr:DUF4239 domain-containing protein [Verrucomicrobiota bacterium]